MRGRLVLQDRFAKVGPARALRVYPLDAIVSGVVKDEGGGPIAGAEVETSGARTVTSHAGEFRVRAASSLLECYVTASADGFAPARIEITAERVTEAAEHDLAMRLASYRGTFVEAGGFFLDGLEPGTWNLRAKGRSGPNEWDGSASIELVARGAAAVTIALAPSR